MIKQFEEFNGLAFIKFVTGILGSYRSIWWTQLKLVSVMRFSANDLFDSDAVVLIFIVIVNTAEVGDFLYKPQPPNSVPVTLLSHSNHSVYIYSRLSLFHILGFEFVSILFRYNTRLYCALIKHKIAMAIHSIHHVLGKHNFQKKFQIFQWKHKRCCWRWWWWWW